MTSPGQLLGNRQSRDQVPVATTPVHNHGNRDCTQELSGHYRKTQDHLNLKVGVGGSLCEGPTQWGIKRKVDAIAGSDHCVRLLREKPNDFYLRRVIANEIEVGQLVPFNFMHSQREQWASPSPSPATYPIPPKLNGLYGLQSCTARGFLKRTLSCNAVKDPKSFKDHHNRSSINMLKLPKDMQGRWSSERYKSAQLKLIDIMHERRAQPGRPILRPALREEARKHIGDTGLLDHLLKHMTDTVVSTGERFRRRHNSEGAMEYWLEDASLMEIRKAAGIEDPSWLPPQGWKPGDKVQGRLWEISRGMSSSEVAEMSQLKDTVGILKREMKILFERLKDLKQMGALQVQDAKDADSVKPRQNVHSAHWRSCDELNKKVEEQQAEQISAAGSNTLEWQLADIRKAVGRMQSDVQCIIDLLDPQPHARTPQHDERFGNGMPGSLLSTGEEVISATNVSETLNPASSSRGVVNAAHLEPLAREFASVSSATSSSTDADGPTTKEMKRVAETPEQEQLKMGGISVPRDCPCPKEAARAFWLNLTTKSTNHGAIPGTNNTRRPNDYMVNPSQRDQPGISASTNNSPEGSPIQINVPNVVRTLAKDNCPVAAAMAGMFGCMVQQANVHPMKGDNPNHHVGTDFRHPQLQHKQKPDHFMAVGYSATSARKPEKCMVSHASKVIPVGFERAFGACQATIRLKPSDDTSPSSHPGPPLSLSLSLTLGSPVGDDSVAQHP